MIAMVRRLIERTDGYARLQKGSLSFISCLEAVEIVRKDLGSCRSVMDPLGATMTSYPKVGCLFIESGKAFENYPNLCKKALYKVSQMSILENVCTNIWSARDDSTFQNRQIRIKDAKDPWYLSCLREQVQASWRHRGNGDFTPHPMRGSSFYRFILRKSVTDKLVQRCSCL